jgi:hypothetical protein
MPTIKDLRSLAIGATSIAVLQGNQYEFLPFHAHVEFALVAENSSVTATVYAGSDVLQQSGPVQQKAAPASAVYPDDFLLDDTVMAGDRLNVQLTNGNAAAVNALTVVKITPV